VKASVMEISLSVRLPGTSIRTLGWLAGVVAAATLLATPVMAQGFFDNFFGSFERRSFDRRPFDRRSDRPLVGSYADPNSDFREAPQERRPAAPRGAPSVTFCVRTCDGRYYPIHRVRGVDAAELCNSFCPASETRAFSGSAIDHAVANDGTRYASLRNAFAYRERTVENCTCNGRDPYGLVPLTIADDATLRAGDVVATNDGFVAYNGNRRNAKFTPVESYRGLSREWRQRLSRTRIVPNATPVSPEVIRESAAAQGGRERRAELDR
jgi:Protein of unknown function (DUF2865)